jgi:hypothetical protein
MRGIAGEEGDERRRGRAFAWVKGALEASEKPTGRSDVVRPSEWQLCLLIEYRLPRVRKEPFCRGFLIFS